VRVLAIDVGAGTSDILLWDREARGENQTHLIVPSATRLVGDEIRAATARGLPVVFTGPLMGGGASVSAMRDHVEEGLAFYADPWAARTFSDDLDEVAAAGVIIIGADEAAALAGREDHMVVRSGDIRFEPLMEALRLLGETRSPDGFSVAVQDHGHAPLGVSDRVFRFARLAEILDRSGHLSSWFYRRDAIPAWATRQEAAASCLPRDVSLVMGDTGPAALWGAALAIEAPSLLAINYGNAHTIMSIVRGEQLDGLFEHHTRLMRPEAMVRFLKEFAAGTIRGQEVLQDGGHGAIAPQRPIALGECPIVVTGPNRAAFRSVDERQIEAAMHGDMMLTGCYGLLQAYLTHAL